MFCCVVCEMFNEALYCAEFTDDDILCDVLCEQQLWTKVMYDANQINVCHIDICARWWIMSLLDIFACQIKRFHNWTSIWMLFDYEYESQLVGNYNTIRVITCQQ